MGAAPRSPSVKTWRERAYLMKADPYALLGIEEAAMPSATRASACSLTRFGGGAWCCETVTRDLIHAILCWIVVDYRYCLTYHNNVTDCQKNCVMQADGEVLAPRLRQPRSHPLSGRSASRLVTPPAPHPPKPHLCRISGKNSVEATTPPGQMDGRSTGQHRPYFRQHRQNLRSRVHGKDATACKGEAKTKAAPNFNVSNGSALAVE